IGLRRIMLISTLTINVWIQSQRYLFRGSLRDFTLDTLKLDSSFIKGLPADNYATGICTALIKMAEIMDLNVVAEGVENSRQLEWLSQENVQQCQGYYFNEPVTLTDQETSD
ncbi:MAG: EAL domain-containing protein, partial [Candidatus Thiodiazotropha sp.]